MTPATASGLPYGLYATLTILGMAVVTLVARGLFLYTKREVRVPTGVQRALQVAPLAAIVAVLAPEIVMTHGAFVETWRDARLFAAAAATLFYVWRPGMLGPLLAGLAVYLPLHLAW